LNRFYDLFVFINRKYINFWPLPISQFACGLSVYGTGEASCAKISRAKWNPEPKTQFSMDWFKGKFTGKPHM